MLMSLIRSDLEAFHDIGAAESEPSMQHGREAGESIDDRGTRSLRPVANWSLTRSIAQLPFDRVAGLRSSRSIVFRWQVEFGPERRILPKSIYFNSAHPPALSSPRYC